MGSTRKRSATPRPALQFAIIGVVVVALVAGLYFFIDSRRNAPDTPPNELEVTASIDGKDVSTLPFKVCELDQADCPEGDIAFVDTSNASNGSIRIKVPDEVSSQQWTLLGVYDDPAANTTRTFTPGEAYEVDVPITVERSEEEGGPTSVVVIEVSTLLVDHNDADEEVPVQATWSFTTQKP